MCDLFVLGKFGEARQCHVRIVRHVAMSVPWGVGHSSAATLGGAHSGYNMNQHDTTSIYNLYHPPFLLFRNHITFGMYKETTSNICCCTSMAVCFAMLVLLSVSCVAHCCTCSDWSFMDLSLVSRRTTSWPSQRQTYSWTTHQHQPKSLFAGWCSSLGSVACNTECLYMSA